MSKFLDRWAPLAAFRAYVVGRCELQIAGKERALP